MINKKLLKNQVKTDAIIKKKRHPLMYAIYAIMILLVVFLGMLAINQAFGWYYNFLIR